MTQLQAEAGLYLTLATQAKMALEEELALQKRNYDQLCVEVDLATKNLECYVAAIREKGIDPGPFMEIHSVWASYLASGQIGCPYQ